jgi:RNA polymerase sigma-70 factor (ECF subfamily)
MAHDSRASSNPVAAGPSYLFGGMVVGPRHTLALVESREHDLAALLARVARGDMNALATVYDQTVAAVYGLVLRILGDTSAAEEVTADVFVQVWQRAADYDARRGPALPWLLLLARSRALDRWRTSTVARTRTEPIDVAAELPTPEPGPHASAETAERRRLVIRAIATLPTEQRHALELAYYRGLSHAEIAAAISEPLGTVKTRIRTAMIRLRSVLAPELGSVS